MQTNVKDLNAMLPAQRERLDSLYLDQREWPYAIWRERYHEHPLVGTLARRLIWNFTTDSSQLTGIWSQGEFCDVEGKRLTIPEDAQVTLWHPIGQPIEQIKTWRELLASREIVQPFKQAHREVYLLTQAEERTRTYSNRFAAHILRQHQFNALCAARGWKNKLRLMVDDDYPPASRLLEKWNLRAEYWIEGIRNDMNVDINQAGAYLYLSTDQVRFYPLAAPQVSAHAEGGGYTNWANADEPLPLEQIPPLVFSEIFRDVDLFVGVASIGNDPNWHDGGRDQQHVGYWQGYSFGELTATAQTRREILAGLIPRLKIGSQCTVGERFLEVRGKLRSYKIHFGSGNILMHPNDQYLCIVPKQSVSSADKLYLPFEGDKMISIILSKAFLLAEDHKITDTTITSQILTA